MSLLLLGYKKTLAASFLPSFSFPCLLRGKPAAMLGAALREVHVQGSEGGRQSNTSGRPESCLSHLSERGSRSPPQESLEMTPAQDEP